MIFPVASATATVRQLGRVYEQLGSLDALQHDTFAGDHQWHGARVPAFLEQHL
jgi:hypothetical protein